MILITALLLVGLAISLPIFIATKNNIVEAITISIGVALYHFVMRLAVGSVVGLIMKNKANYKSIWFREKSFEKRLYRLMRVQKWKKLIPTYSPEAFDTSQKTTEEIIGATCQAEIVHEVIMAFSLLPIILIPFLGGAVALIITSVFSMIFDYMFVVLQRYNRPKLIRVAERFKSIKG